MSKPLVQIGVTVYNFEPFLRQCLDGIVMQKTNFEFEAIVHDDVSTDKSMEIISEYAQKYPHIIRPIFATENRWSKHTLYSYLDSLLTAKYLCTLDGDDFWTDPLKLQKQVDFLEANTDVALCHANSKVLVGDVMHEAKNKSFRQDMLEDLLLRDNIFTATVMVRTDLWLKAEEELQSVFGNHPLPFNDHSSWAFLALHHKFHYMDDVVSCYRILPESACHTNDVVKNYKYSSEVAYFHQAMFDYCRKQRAFSSGFIKDFYETLFHLRKRALREAGLRIGYPQIWELIKLLPYWPMVMYRWLKRKVNGK